MYGLILLSEFYTKTATLTCIVILSLLLSLTITDTILYHFYCIRVFFRVLLACVDLMVERSLATQKVAGSNLGRSVSR